MKLSDKKQVVKSKHTAATKIQSVQRARLAQRAVAEIREHDGFHSAEEGGSSLDADECDAARASSISEAPAYADFAAPSQEEIFRCFDYFDEDGDGFVAMPMLRKLGDALGVPQPAARALRGMAEAVARAEDVGAVGGLAAATAYVPRHISRNGFTELTRRWVASGFNLFVFHERFAATGTSKHAEGVAPACVSGGGPPSRTREAEKARFHRAMYKAVRDDLVRRKATDEERETLSQFAAAVRAFRTSYAEISRRVARGRAAPASPEARRGSTGAGAWYPSDTATGGDVDAILLGSVHRKASAGRPEDMLPLERWMFDLVYSEAMKARCAAAATRRADAERKALESKRASVQRRCVSGEISDVERDARLVRVDRDARAGEEARRAAWRRSEEGRAVLRLNEAFCRRHAERPSARSEDLRAPADGTKTSTAAGTTTGWSLGAVLLAGLVGVGTGFVLARAARQSPNPRRT
jgi:hypothetical protein